MAHARKADAGGSQAVTKRGRSGPLSCATILFLSVAQLAAAAPPLPRQQELVALVRQDCGSCHGMTLAGGLGPPLLPATLRDKPAESLVSTILHGRPGTPMPPWEPFLSEAEASWLVEMLIKGFPHGR